MLDASHRVQLRRRREELTARLPGSALPPLWKATVPLRARGSRRPRLQLVVDARRPRQDRVTRIIPPAAVERTRQRFRGLVRELVETSERLCGTLLQAPATNLFSGLGVYF